MLGSAGAFREALLQENRRLTVASVTPLRGATRSKYPHPRYAMNRHSEAFDQWIRGRFVELNTTLEEVYFQEEDRQAIEGVGGDEKRALHDEGRELIAEVLQHADLHRSFDDDFDLLGNVGLYMGACERHGITQIGRDARSPLVEASALAMQLGASLDMAPRFVASHFGTHNRVVNGHGRRFTSLRDDDLFFDYNTRSVFLYKRAAESLFRIRPLGLSHEFTLELLTSVRDTLEKILALNKVLFRDLDVDRFFYSVRPYFKPYRVGSQVYRGGNGGDTAAVHVVDLILGLCRANHGFYASMMHEKLPFLVPEDRAQLRACMRHESLFDGFMKQVNEGGSRISLPNLKMFLEICDLYGRVAAQHHDELVNRFIERPSSALPQVRMEHLTTSGPPLSAVLNALERLRDLRLAADRKDIPSRRQDLDRLKALVPKPGG
jgi:Domain of unknown function (DUF1864)